MSRFNGSITITSNDGSQNLQTVTINHNTRSALDQALIDAANAGKQTAAQNLADWDGAVTAVNS